MTDAPPPIRLLICDVDGTLVRHDKTLAEATIAAFKRLREIGLPATLISARPPSGIIWLADALEIDAPLGAFNGGTLFLRDGTILASTRLPPHVARTALEMLDAAGIAIWLFADSRWYARNADSPHVPRERLSAGIDVTLCDDLAAFADRADKIVGVDDRADFLIGVEDRLRGAVGHEATVARSQTYYLDVTALTANKGHGIAALAGSVGIPLGDVAVIGDMANDLPMFARAGLAIAMGQAPEAVRAAAAFVTESNDRDGVALAIERYILPRVRAADAAAG